MSLEINNSDLAYFLKIPDYIVSQVAHFWGMEKQRPKIPAFLKSFRREFGRRNARDEVTYRMSSQVYEARDLGFTNEEIKKLSNIQEKTLEYILSNEKEISSKIIGALRTIYFDKEIEKPYLISQK